MGKIKTLSKILFVFVGILLLTTSCDWIFGDPSELTEDVHNIIPSDILEEFKNLGIEIHGGKKPPKIEGTYKISPCVLVKSNFSDTYSVGYVFTDKVITFSRQNNAKLTVVCDYVQGQEKGDGIGSFITGNGNKFSIYSEINGTLHDEPFKSVFIYSGEISTDGIINYHEALMVTMENRYTIRRGQGRLFKDSDGLAEKTTQTRLQDMMEISTEEQKPEALTNTQKAY
ncbi:MAG: hypothetical protein WBK97_06925 [Bacteroidales bacterium]|jgi:hypothetical protein